MHLGKVPREGAEVRMAEQVYFNRKPVTKRAFVWLAVFCAGCLSGCGESDNPLRNRPEGSTVYLHHSLEDGEDEGNFVVVWYS
jgi:hypothetical protein